MPVTAQSHYDFTEQQQEPQSWVPDPPMHMLQTIAVRGHQVIEGHRSLLQFGSWITQELADQLSRQRAWRAERTKVCRDGRATVIPRPGSVLICRPSSHAAEATVLLHLGPNIVAVAIRLEFLSQRWRATQLAVL